MSSNQPRQTKAQRREAARLKAKELREASARRERRNMIARRSFIGVAGLGVTGGLGYLVYRGVEAKNGTKDNKSSSKFPAPSEGLATAKANQSGIPKQVPPSTPSPPRPPSWTSTSTTPALTAPSSRASTPRRSTSS